MNFRNAGCMLGVCLATRTACLIFVVLTKFELKWRKREKGRNNSINVFNEMPIYTFYEYNN